MPNSNYIKMCDCPEIQDGWEPKIGDWTDKGVMVRILYQGIDSEIGFAGEYILNYGKGEFQVYYEEFIWLPTIEQLMGMVDKDEEFEGALIDFTNEFHPDGNHPDYCLDDDFNFIFKSWQELCLAYIMRELHNKKWNGEKWENEEEN